MNLSDIARVARSTTAVRAEKARLAADAAARLEAEVQKIASELDHYLGLMFQWSAEQGKPFSTNFYLGRNANLWQGQCVTPKPGRKYPEVVYLGGSLTLSPVDADSLAEALRRQLEQIITDLPQEGFTLKIGTIEVIRTAKTAKVVVHDIIPSWADEVPA